MANSFGAFFKQKRQEKNLTQKELAQLLFVSESAVSKWEKNIAHPDITLLPKLAEILAVSEHELITASIDNKSREEKSQAKKWRTFSMSWSLFFYISYTIALISCFICNLVIDKTLSWFWIVASALLLAFTFTNLPKHIKKHKLVLIPLSMYLVLSLLLAVCAIYTDGNWFWVADLSVLFGLIVIFVPIYISKLKVFLKLKKFNDFVSLGIDFVALNILLVVINIFTISNGYNKNLWYFKIALPIVISIYLFLNLLLCVRFFKLNRLIKTSIILFLIDLLYLIVPFINVKNLTLQREIDDVNIFKADFSRWIPELTLDNNIHLIIALSLLGLAILFLTSGLILHYFKKKKQK
ncbi:MAG: helix-turn-helix domain-containing protein [Clostridia bacterium]|nr:helix-turn-helix domain-containing protein [Clostridia bacterium]